MGHQKGYIPGNWPDRNLPYSTVPLKLDRRDAEDVCLI